MYLLLSENRVFVKGLEICLEKREKQKEQLSDLLPEFSYRKRKFEFENRNIWHNSNKVTKFSSLHIKNLTQTTLDLTTGIKIHKATTMLGNHKFQRNSNNRQDRIKKENNSSKGANEFLRLFRSPKGLNGRFGHVSRISVGVF